MGNVSVKEISSKLDSLSSQERKEIFDLMNLLIRKKRHKKRKSDKQLLLDVSVWKDKDLKVFDEIAKDMGKWTIGKF